MTSNTHMCTYIYKKINKRDTIVIPKSKKLP